MRSNKIEEIGNRLKQARKSLHIQQKDAALKLDVSAGHLSEIEAGKANASLDLLLRLAELYNISSEYIFSGRGEMFYDAAGKGREEPFDFTSDVDNMDDLLWLLKNSGYVKVSVMGYVSKLIIDEETVIKTSLRKKKSGSE